jgi:hypothetical protein
LNKTSEEGEKGKKKSDKKRRNYNDSALGGNYPFSSRICSRKRDGPSEGDGPERFFEQKFVFAQQYCEIGKQFQQNLIANPFRNTYGIKKTNKSYVEHS